MERTMRAKMRVTMVNRTTYCDEVHMEPVHKSDGYDESGLDEDNTFAKFTPAGELKLSVANPALFGKINPGEKYYLDFTLAD